MIKDQISIAVDLLQQGELVAFPTDTVYGLGADAVNEQAILKVFKLKQRSLNLPLIVHIPNIDHLSIWADCHKLQPDVFKLIETFWPGPVTVVVKKAAEVSSLITAGQDSIALRIPNHPIALELLKNFNSGIVGTSANLSGHNSLISSTQVIKEFNNNVFVLEEEGYIGEFGVESTIVSLVEEPMVLRQGAVTVAQLKSCLGRDIRVISV